AMLHDLQRALAERVPDAQVVARSFGQGPPVDAEVEIEIRGPGLETLQALGEAVRVQLARHPDVLHTQVTLDRGDPKLWVRVDEDETRSTGLSLRDVANQLERRLEGAAGGSMVDGFEELPVRVRTEDAERADREGLASFRLVRREAGTGGEGWLPLDAIGEVELRPAIGGITRCEGMRCNTVGAYLRAGAYPIDVTRAVVDGLAESGFELPVGYTLSVGGDSEEQNRAITSLLTYAPILGILMVATVVLAFRSARLAVLLFSVAGLSVGVGLLATWLAGFPFSFNTILGTAGLIGVALNDSIVVLAALREDERARRGEIDAVVDAVLGCGRHVLSTTFTTIAGFVPLLLFVGGDFWPPLAIVLAGGVGGATILATLFVPAGYCLLAPGLERTRATSFEAVPVAG
ncbi:MAG: efflux RND transporter permease subunit, partial [Myxococcota bacterium]